MYVRRRLPVAIPSSVTSIGDSAFYGCYRLTTMEIPISVTQIGRRAFKECENLKASIKKDLRARFGDELFPDFVTQKTFIL